MRGLGRAVERTEALWQARPAGARQLGIQSTARLPLPLAGAKPSAPAAAIFRLPASRSDGRGRDRERAGERERERREREEREEKKGERSTESPYTT